MRIQRLTLFVLMTVLFPVSACKTTDTTTGPDSPPSVPVPAEATKETTLTLTETPLPAGYGAHGPWIDIYFTDPESRYPVISTTSKLMTTGVDTQTTKLIVLDQNIQSMTEFKQIIGRGTRIQEDYGKFYFTIMDLKKATKLFADKDLDGDQYKYMSQVRMNHLCHRMMLI